MQPQHTQPLRNLMTGLGNMTGNMSELLFPKNLSSAEGGFAEKKKDVRALLEDNNGAIMIIGLGMAIFCIGILYYLAGVGDAVVYRERVQDVSDTGTFAASAVSARGMNIVAILNIISAICIAILLALRVVQAIAIAGIAIASIVSALCFGCAAPAIPPLQAIQQATNSAYNALEPVMKAINKGCYYAQLGVKYAWPVASQGRAIQAMTLKDDVYEKSQFGMVWPIYPATFLGYKENGLPIEDDSLWVLCERGGEYLKDAVALPFSFIPIIGGKLGSFIGSAAQGIAHAFYPFFCGSPPAGWTPDAIPTTEESETFPADTFRNACNKGCSDESTGAGRAMCGDCLPDPGHPGCSDDLRNTCEEAARRERESLPVSCRLDGAGEPMLDSDGECTSVEERDGGCAGTDDPSACRTRVNQAASQCLSGFTGSERKFDYRYEDRYRVYYKVLLETGCQIRYFDSGEEGNMSSSATVTRDPEGNRIRTATPASLINGEYKIDVGSVNSPYSFGACSNGARSPFASYCDYPNVSPTPGGVECNALPDGDSAYASFSSGSLHFTTEKRRVLSEIYQCSRTVEKELEVEGGEAGGSGEWKPPQRVHGELRLGDNDFQYRSVAIAIAPPDLGDRGVQFANMYAPEGSDPGSGFSTFSDYARFGIAQSEYYWQNDSGGWSMADHNIDDNGAEYLWYMGWQARMRRTNLATIFGGGTGEGSADEGAFTGAIPSGGGSSGGAGGFVSSIISGLVVH